MSDESSSDEPTSDTAVVEILRAAAAEAIASGSPDTAAARLARALVEPVAATDLAAVLHELGRAEAAAVGKTPSHTTSLFSNLVWRVRGAPNQIGKKRENHLGS